MCHKKNILTSPTSIMHCHWFGTLSAAMHTGNWNDGVVVKCLILKWFDLFTLIDLFPMFSWILALSGVYSEFGMLPVSYHKGGGAFLKRLTLILAWIKNHTPSKVRETTYRSQMSPVVLLTVRNGERSFTPHFIMDAITYPCGGIINSC